MAKSVWRRPKNLKKGRYRQFAQADLDIIGADSVSADVDTILTIATALDVLLPEKISATMTIKHRALLTGLIRAQLGLTTANWKIKF